MAFCTRLERDIDALHISLLQQLILKDLHTALYPLDYLLPGGVTDLQVEVLYS